MNDTLATSQPNIWAIGGGKGGVGKSLVSILIASELARRNLKTILIDADLGGANLHTMLGIKSATRTLNDFVNRKYESMDDVCVPTPVNNLQLICGASEILSLANPQYAQKTKIVQNLTQLTAEHVVLDLGAGTSYNVLDFFLIADHPIVVVTPQPISIQNAYGFVRNAIFRKLSRLASGQSTMQNLIKTAMDPNNKNQLRTIQDLYCAIDQSDPTQAVKRIKDAISQIRPWVVTNMAKAKRDGNAGRIIQLVAEKYLTLQVKELGSIYYDPIIEDMVSRMKPISSMPSECEALENTASLVQRLLNGV